MGTTNVVTNEYMKDERRFADAFNFFLFDGEQIVCSEKLKEADPVELAVIMEGDQPYQVEKIRDVLKNSLFLTDGDYSYLLMGIENQAEVHMAMPVRSLIYDGLCYGEQVTKRTRQRRALKMEEDSAEFLSGFGRKDRIKPVLTLIILWKAGPWNGPKCLFDMFDKVDDRVKEYVNDYKIHVIVPDEIDDFNKFRTELGVALEFIAGSQKHEYIDRIRTNERFKKVTNETVNLLNICTGAAIELNEKEGVVDMCKGIEDLKQIVREEARSEGMMNVNRLNQWLIENDRISDLQRSIVDLEFQQQLLAELNLA